MSLDRPHHPFSCSQLASLQACASYEGQQSKTPHIRTVIGTKSHAVVETGNDDPTLSDEEAAHVAACMSLYESEKKVFGEGVIELSEVYLSIDELNSTAGYIDAALISANGAQATLLDWKFGMHGVPPAKENLQTRAYCLGLFRAYPRLQQVKVLIFQPTVSDEPSVAVFTRDEVPAMHTEIWAIVTRAKAAREAGDFAAARPAYPLCSFCKRAGVCPALTKLAGEVGHKFSPLHVPADVTPSTIQDPAQVIQALQLAQTVEAWAKSFRQHVTDRVLTLQAPPPPGYRLESRSKREITDAAKFKEIALQSLTPEEYEATLTPGLTAVEDLISTKAPRGQKTAAVKQFAEQLETSGAIARGESYSFLKAVPQRANKNKTTDKQQTDQ